MSMACTKHASAWVLGAGCWVLGTLDFGLWTLDCDWVLGAGCWVLGAGDFGLRTPDCKTNSPLSRYRSASNRRSPVVCTAASASVSRVRACSRCPIFPYTSACRARKYGCASSAPVVRLAARPWCICASPSSICPCSTNAQPRLIVPADTKGANPCSLARVIPASARCWAAGPSRRS